jgi:hypothetical protein
MARVTREIGRVVKGGDTTVYSIVFDDADGRIASLIMVGNANERSIMGIGGGGASRTDGLKNDPTVTIDLLPDNIFMIDDGGVWKKPAGLKTAIEMFHEQMAPAEITRRRGGLKPAEPIRLPPRVITP